MAKFSIEPKKGSAGSTQVRVTAESENTDVTNKNLGSIVFTTTDGTSKAVNVYQYGTTVLRLSAATTRIDADATTASITVSSWHKGTVTPIRATASAGNVTVGRVGVDSIPVTITVPTNLSANDITYTVTIIQEGTNRTATWEVVQAAATGRSITSVAFGATGSLSYNNGINIPYTSGTYQPTYRIPIIVNYTQGESDINSYYLSNQGNNLPEGFSADVNFSLQINPDNSVNYLTGVLSVIANGTDAIINAGTILMNVAVQNYTSTITANKTLSCTVMQDAFEEQTQQCTLTINILPTQAANRAVITASGDFGTIQFVGNSHVFNVGTEMDVDISSAGYVSALKHYELSGDFTDNITLTANQTAATISLVTIDTENPLYKGFHYNNGQNLSGNVQNLNMLPDDFYLPLSILYSNGSMDTTSYYISKGGASVPGTLSWQYEIGGNVYEQGVTPLHIGSRTGTVSGSLTSWLGLGERSLDTVTIKIQDVSWNAPTTIASWELKQNSAASVNKITVNDSSPRYLAFTYNNRQDFTGINTTYTNFCPDDFYLPLNIVGESGDWVIRGYSGSLYTSLPAGYTYRFKVNPSSVFSVSSTGCIGGTTTRNTDQRRQLSIVTIVVNDGEDDYEIASYTIYQAVAAAAEVVGYSLSMMGTLTYNTINNEGGIASPVYNIPFVVHYSDNSFEDSDIYHLSSSGDMIPVDYTVAQSFQLGSSVEGWSLVGGTIAASATQTMKSGYVIMTVDLTYDGNTTQYMYSGTVIQSANSSAAAGFRLLREGQATTPTERACMWAEFNGNAVPIANITWTNMNPEILTLTEVTNVNRNRYWLTPLENEYLYTFTPLTTGTAEIRASYQSDGQTYTASINMDIFMAEVRKISGSDYIEVGDKAKYGVFLDNQQVTDIQFNWSHDGGALSYLGSPNKGLFFIAGDTLPEYVVTTNQYTGNTGTIYGVQEHCTLGEAQADSQYYGTLRVSGTINGKLVIMNYDPIYIVPSTNSYTLLANGGSIMPGGTTQWRAVDTTGGATPDETTDAVQVVWLIQGYRMTVTLDDQPVHPNWYTVTASANMYGTEYVAAWKEGYIPDALNVFVGHGTKSAAFMVVGTYYDELLQDYVHGDQVDDDTTDGHRPSAGSLDNTIYQGETLVWRHRMTGLNGGTYTTYLHTYLPLDEACGVNHAQYAPLSYAWDSGENAYVPTVCLPIVMAWVNTPSGYKTSYGVQYTTHTTYLDETGKHSDAGEGFTYDFQYGYSSTDSFVHVDPTTGFVTLDANTTGIARTATIKLTLALVDDENWDWSRVMLSAYLTNSTSQSGYATSIDPTQQFLDGRLTEITATITQEP